MFEIRIHGRGGHGVVTLAEMLSVAAFTDGHFGLASPALGVEHAGTPTVAYCRVDDVPIRDRAPVLTPDAIIVQDPGLARHAEVYRGLKPGGFVLINSRHTPAGLMLDDVVDLRQAGGVACVPASEISQRESGRSLPNAALLGGLSVLCGIVSPAAALTAIREQFAGHTAETNAAAAQDAMDYVRLATRGDDLTARR
jgi:pyruvate ferredoxin oxidoreductase gamma subunit